MFNVIDDPWISVLEGGRARDVSWRELLLRAPELDRLAAPPPVTLAMLRFVMALLLHALGPPRSTTEWRERWDAGSFPTGVLEDYFDQWHHRFELFSEDTPFAQAPGIETVNGELKPVSVLIASEPVGNAVPIFGARTEANPPTASAAEATRYLLATLGWDTAGIKPGLVGDPTVKGGKGYGNPVGPLGMLGGAFPVGRTVFETLLLNLPIREDGTAQGDAPCWAVEEPPGGAWQQRSPLGILDLLTWGGRQIRLVPDERDGELVVRQVVLGGGDRMITTPHDHEPHTVWRWFKGDKQREPGYRPKRFPSGRAVWEGLDALVTLGVDSDPETDTSMLLRQVGNLQAEGALEPTYPLSVWTCGFEYGIQSAVVENIVSDALPLPVAALGQDAEAGEFLVNVATSTAALVSALDGLDGDLRRATGGDPLPWDSGQRPGTLLVPRLDLHARRVLAGLQRDPGAVDQARTAWGIIARRTVDELADELLRGVAPEARVGRDVQVGGRTRRFNAALAETTYWRRRNEALAEFSEPTHEEVG